MEFSMLAVIGIGLAAMFFGYGFGLFEGRGQGYKRRKQEEAKEEALRPAPPPAPAPVESSLLKLRVDENNQLLLAVDDQPVWVNQLAPQQRKRLIDLVVLMRPWMEAAPSAAAPAQTVPPPVAARPQAPAGTAGMAPAAPRPLTPAPAAAPRPAAPAATPGAATKPPAAAANTMIEQIDVLLQARLVGTPLAGRGIRLAESPEGGVIVMDGLNRYAGVADVADPQVQALIRAAIAEWEKKYTPGA